MSLTLHTWRPAVSFAEPAGAALTAMIARPVREWGAAPHAAAALAWKTYSWWLVDPVVHALAGDAPVPRLDLANVEVLSLAEPPYLRFRTVDPRPLEGYDVLGQTRASLVDGHLAPVADAVSAATRVGLRTLWGSVAEAVSYPLLAAGRADLADLVLETWSLRSLLDPVTGPEQPLRRTCCLAVTVPGLGMCDTCPVVRRLSAGAASMSACSR